MLKAAIHKSHLTLCEETKHISSPLGEYLKIFAIFQNIYACIPRFFFAEPIQIVSGTLVGKHYSVV
jgi:hypothetical protein